MKKRYTEEQIIGFLKEADCCYRLSSGLRDAMDLELQSATPKLCKDMVPDFFKSDSKSDVGEGGVTGKKNIFRPVAVSVCFVASGFAALIYQVVWLRLFSIVFGSTAVSAAVVLGGYMAGLAIGAAIAARFERRVARPMRAYALVEVAIALAALAVPVGMKLAQSFYIDTFGDLEVLPGSPDSRQALFYLTTAFSLLVVPTLCIGATLPLIARTVVANDAQVGSRIGLLYAGNTVGAVTGAVAAGYWLVPLLGLQATTWVAVCINLAVAAVALMLNRDSTAQQEDLPGLECAVPPARDGWLLPAMALSGVCTFAYEVIWTGMLSHTLGGSLPAFATMLASFLAGIAIGGALAPAFARSQRGALVGFALAQFLIGATSIATYISIDAFSNHAVGFSANRPLAFLLLLPSTIAIGATFPLAVRVLAAGRINVGSATGRVFSWNTIGGIAGAMGTALLLLPSFRYEGAVKVVACLNFLVGGIAVLWLVARPLLAAGGLVTFLLAYVFLFSLPVPESLLRTSSITAPLPGKLVYYEVGKSADVSVIEHRGVHYLRSNGLPESGALLAGAPPFRASQQLLGTLPVLARPDADSALLIGLGAGVAVTGVPPTVSEVDVVELEPRIVEANQIMAPRRSSDPLADPRVRLIINDARNALLLSSRKYDFVVSQPSHPWTAGSSHLYTVEFQRLVAARLEQGGVFLQWMNSEFLSPELLGSLCATTLKVFPNVRVYQWAPGELMLLASAAPIRPEQVLLSTGRPLADAPNFYARLGITSPEDLLAALLLDQDGVVAMANGRDPFTDDRNTLATISGTLLEDGNALTQARLLALVQPHVPALRFDSWLFRDYGNQLKLDAVAERLQRFGGPAFVREFARTLDVGRYSAAPLVLARLANVRGMEREASELLIAAMIANPNDARPKYSLLEPWSGRLGEAGMPPLLRAVRSQIDGVPAAVFEARAAAAVGNWNAVANAESILASARPVDPWYGAAVRLRAEWRMSRDSVNRGQYVNEALNIIDEAIAGAPDSELLALRAAIAFADGQHEAFLQTLRFLLVEVDSELDGLVFSALRGDIAGSLEMQAMRLQAMRQAVQGLGRSAAIDFADSQELAAQIDEVVSRLRERARERAAVGG